MNIKTIEAFQCPECTKFFTAPHIPLPIEAYQCGQCHTIYEDKQDALRCCLE